MHGVSAQRSKNMAAIKSTNTRPEIVVRKLMHAMGCRFRLHAKELPGKPDIVNRTRKKAIFVNGCFWHSHGSPSCRRSNRPKARIEYWTPKLRRNVERDDLNLARLLNDGYSILVVWECEIIDQVHLRKVLDQFWR
ncbi:very short patch repair endonuclease [Rhizobium leguminosarum]|uniref:very short patch repair endonuclease n=1 Tax=Rhizobium leguminosarum TaxID=384 RepID=UPI003F94B323